MLLRAWNAPISHENMMSFQPELRNAVKTIMLSVHRLGMPRESGWRICEFLSRDWWADERRQCWNYYCQLKQISKESELRFRKWEDRAAQPSKTTELIFCPTCRVALYCCEECRDEDWTEMHKWKCNAPPCRRPGNEEEILVHRLMIEDQSTRENGASSVDLDVVQPARPGNPRTGARSDAVPNVELIEAAREDDDDWEDADEDDEDWEDINSDDEAADDGPVSPTRVIYNFFSTKTYVPREIAD